MAGAGKVFYSNFPGMQSQIAMYFQSETVYG